jgi:hypothetical protein
VSTNHTIALRATPVNIAPRVVSSLGTRVRTNDAKSISIPIDIGVDPDFEDVATYQVEVEPFVLGSVSVSPTAFTNVTRVVGRGSRDGLLVFRASPARARAVLQTLTVHAPRGGGTLVTRVVDMTNVGGAARSNDLLVFVETGVSPAVITDSPPAPDDPLHPNATVVTVVHERTTAEAAAGAAIAGVVIGLVSIGMAVVALRMRLRGDG